MLLPSPGAYDTQQGGSQHPCKVRGGGHQVGIRDVAEWELAGRDCPCGKCVITEIPLLPTPAVNDMGAAYTPEQWDEWTATMKAKHNNGNGHGKSLNVEAQRLLLPTPAARDGKGYGPADLNRNDPNLSALPLLLPTPTAQDSAQSGGGYNGQTNVTLTDATVRQPARWGEYEPAIRRWEALTRPAPDPTKPNSKGNPKLSDEFDEWLMGLTAGWITDVPDITWNEVLKACGNGVVPQQAVAAALWLRVMAAWEVAA